jgi:polyhydroxyalkanoate synthesis regulator phasin
MIAEDALQTLVYKGWITKEEADKITSRNKEQEKTKKAREVASRALADYFNVLLPGTSADENREFVDTLFTQLEKDLKDWNKPKKEDDEIMRFLKKIGAA